MNSIINRNDNHTQLKSACLILASGLGKRFGHNKLLADLNGKTLIQWVLDATMDIFDERIVVTRSDEIASLCASQNISCILHSMPCKNDTIRLGIEALSNDAKFCMFFQADQPLIHHESITSMVKYYHHSPDYIIRAKHLEDVGAPVIFPRFLFDELLKLPTEKGGSEVLRRHPELIKYYNIDNSFELMDVDTPEDLEILQQYCNFSTTDHSLGHL